MRFGLPDQVRYSMQSVFSHYPQIQRVLIYGSRAKGNYRPGSDIDVALIGSSVDNDVLSRVLVELDELNMPYLLDVSVLQEIESASLLEHIQRVGQVFYEKDDTSF